MENGKEKIESAVYCICWLEYFPFRILPAGACVTVPASTPTGGSHGACRTRDLSRLSDDCHLRSSFQILSRHPVKLALL